MSQKTTSPDWKPSYKGSSTIGDLFKKFGLGYHESVSGSPVYETVHFWQPLLGTINATRCYFYYGERGMMICQRCSSFEDKTTCTVDIRQPNGDFIENDAAIHAFESKH